ncbi:MAG: hypothetical protein H6621_07600 [Halobacteriovoraceae bacterium]|nr:hypothetical protein [Halobacteriovoraceae bacterium]
MKKLIYITILIIPFTILAAPNPDVTGPYATAREEYKLPAQVYKDVLDDRKTELWAAVYHPKTSRRSAMPLIIFLHGNHATCGHGSNPRIDNDCTYTYEGTCPEGYVVVPNHLGYDDVASKLASWGYLVVSINANLGINCGGGVAGDGGLNLARGRLILKHLELLSQWNKDGGSTEYIEYDLKGKINFSEVGLMGHSRGGEGIRGALFEYQNSRFWKKKIANNLDIKAMYEIAPVDGQTSEVLNADGIPWGTLLPMCDGDVSNLEGIKPFDRMVNKYSNKDSTFKSSILVWGTNHNFYNSEWQQSDSPGCTNHLPLWKKPQGDLLQKRIRTVALMGFFRGLVGSGANPKFLSQFDPLSEIDNTLARDTAVKRTFVPNVRENSFFTIENFENPTGTNTYGHQNNSQNISIAHQQKIFLHDFRSRSAALIEPQKIGGFLEIHFADQETGKNLSNFEYIDFDLVHKVFAKNPTDFSVSLLDNSGRESNQVKLSSVDIFDGTVGGPYSDYNQILRTFRFPINWFKDVDKSHLTALKIIFDSSELNSFYGSLIRATNNTSRYHISKRPNRSTRPRHRARKSRPFDFPKHYCRASFAGSEYVKRECFKKVKVTSDTLFKVQDSLPKIKAGGKLHGAFQRTKDGKTKEVTYLIPCRDASFSGSIEIYLNNGLEKVTCR